MITNGEVIINRRRRVGDFEHNDAVVKLSFTCREENNLKEEMFRCWVLDEAVRLADRGIGVPSTTDAVTVPSAPSVSPVPAPAKTAPRKKAAEVADAVETSMVSSIPAPSAPTEAAPVPLAPTPGALPAPVPAPTATGTASVSLPIPVSIGTAVSNPTPAAAGETAPAAAIAPETASTDAPAAFKAFRHEIAREIARINILAPGQGGDIVQRIAMEYAIPPASFLTIPVEKRPAYLADLAAWRPS